MDGLVCNARMSASGRPSTKRATRSSRAALSASTGELNREVGWRPVWPGLTTTGCWRASGIYPPAEAEANYYRHLSETIAAAA